jgi:hypothetical protein
MKLFDLEPSFFESGTLNVSVPINTQPVALAMERCAELGYHNVFMQVSLGYANKPPVVRLDYVKVDPNTNHTVYLGQECSREMASTITLATALILATSRDEPIDEVNINCGGVITLSNGKTTKFFAGSGLIFPHGYQLLLRTPYLACAKTDHQDRPSA